MKKIIHVALSLSLVGFVNIGVSFGEKKAEPVPRESALESTSEPDRKESIIDLVPSGEDNEIPAVLRQKKLRRERATRKDTSRSLWGIFKWVAVGTSVASLVMGITFNRLAASKASDLKNAVKTECPEDQKDCGGNPKMNNPKVPFGERHFNMIQDYDLYQAVSITSFITAGVGAAAAVVMFFLDKPKRGHKADRKPEGIRLGIAPVIGDGVFGVSSELSF